STTPLLASTPFPYTTLFRSLVAEIPARRQAGGGNVAVVDDLDRSRLKSAVIVVVGVTQQAFVVLPVVFRAEGVVNCHKAAAGTQDRKSTRLNSSHVAIPYAL